MTRRILHVIADAQFGGAQWYLVELARVQRTRGDRVTILTGGEGPLLPEYEQVADNVVLSPSLRRGLGPHDLVAPRRVAALARDADVLHAHASKALLASVLSGGHVPVVWSAHGYDSAHAEFRRQVRAPFAFAKAMLARRAGAISAASLNVAEKIVKAGVPRERVRVIYTGVRTERFANVPDVTARRPVVIGAAGRLVGIKGFGVLVEAAARALAEGSDARFLLFGDGPREEELRRRVRELGLADRFELRGPTRDFPAALALMDVVAVPSLVDSFPLVPCEAMVAGRPVIASRVGGLPEAFVDGVHGILVAPGDVAALAAAIGSFASDPGRAATMGAAAKAYARERYRWDRVADEYDDLYALVRR